MSDKWIAEHDKLNQAFDSGAILTASPDELGRHLLTTVQVDIRGEELREKNKRRADVIRHLLQIRITQQLARRAFGVSLLALGISALALIVSAWNALVDASSPPTQIMPRDAGNTSSNTPTRSP